MLTHGTRQVCKALTVPLSDHHRCALVGLLAIREGIKGSGLIWLRHHRLRKHTMPYVNIQITREGTPAEQKAESNRGTTTRLVCVLGKNPATAFVIIDKVDTDNRDIVGQTVTEVAERACGPGSPASIERQPSTD